MNTISLMTMSMLGKALNIYRMDHDRENLEEYYEEMMDLVKAAGYAAVDVAAFEVATMGVDYVKEQLTKRGLRVSSYIYFDKFAMGEVGFDERVANAKKAVDTAVQLGTNVLMLVPQAHDSIENEKPEEIRSRMIAHWIPVAAYAVVQGIHPVVEDTPDLRLCFCKASEVKEVMDAVPGLELVYDSGNMILDGENPVEYVKEFAGRIGFVHLKDVNVLDTVGIGGAEYMRDGTPTGAAPTGTGLIDLKGVVEALLKTGYQGGMTVEYAKHPDKSYLESLKSSREYVERLLSI